MSVNIGDVVRVKYGLRAGQVGIVTNYLAAAWGFDAKWYLVDTGDAVVIFPRDALQRVTKEELAARSAA